MKKSRAMKLGIITQNPNLALMPTVLYVDGFRFYFYSNENNEPIHIHVEKAEANAKYWLEPEIAVAYSYGFSASQSKAIRNVLDANRKLLKDAWNEHFR